jgi:hypothetical protein
MIALIGGNFSLEIVFPHESLQLRTESVPDGKTKA